MSHALEKLLNPKSIALIGASDNPGRIGGMPLELLRDFSFQGQVYPINARYENTFGYPCYAQIEDLPETPDLVVLAIAAKDVTSMLKRCHAKGVPAAIVYAAGFAEEGGQGTVLQDELEDFSRNSGMIIAGPNCMGFANINTRAFTAFASIFRNVSMQTEIGSLSILTQSGNVCSTLYGLVRELDIPVSHFINTGNEACVDFATYLDYLAEDDNTEIILGYIEQIRDGAKFLKACQKLHERGKILIVLKAGTTEKGALAVQSHTSALAGDQKIYAAAFQDMHVIQAEDFAQMAQLALLAQLRHKTAGQKVGIITMSGALGAILSDRFIQVGLELPDLSIDVQKTLRKGIPAYGMVGNPVDVTGNIVNDPTFVSEVLEALAVTASLDAVVIYAPGYMLDRMTEPLIETAKKHSRLFVVIDTGRAKSRELLRKASIAVFSDIGQAVNSLGPFLKWQENRKEFSSLPTEPVVSHDKHSFKSASFPTNEAEALRYLQQFKIAAPEIRIIKQEEHLKNLSEDISFPLVMKVLSADIPHKTEAGAVALNIKSYEELATAYSKIISNVNELCPHANIEGVLIASMQSGVAELIVGATHDPVFGPVLTVGLGGVLTEIYQDTAHALLPVTQEKAKRMLTSLKAFPLLNGFRGKPIADIDAAANAIVAIGQAMLSKQEEISEIEVNPLLVKPKGEGVVMLDALIVPFQAD